MDLAILSESLVVQMTPENHSIFPIRLNSLGSAFSLHYLKLNHKDDKDRTIVILKKVITLTPKDDPQFGIQLSHLGHSLICQFKHTAYSLYYNAAMSYFSKSTRVDSATPISKMKAALIWPEHCSLPNLTVEPCSIAFLLFPPTVSFSLNINERHIQLFTQVKTLPNGIYTACIVNQVDHAFEQFEQSQSVVWS